MKTLVLLLLASALARAQRLEDTVAIYGGVFDDLSLHGKSTTDDAKRIYLIQRGSKKILWKSEQRIKAAKISPNGKYVAFITETDLENGETKNFDHAYHLLVIDRKGSLLKDIYDGVLFSWSPSGTRLAYVTGLRIEEKEGFDPLSTGIYDVQKKILLGLPFKTFDLRWAFFDGKIYYFEYQTGKVNSFDTKSSISTPTNYLGIDFSPDGRYYFRKQYEADEFALYSSNNADLTPVLLRITGLTHVQQLEWVDQSQLLLKNGVSSRDLARSNVIYDPSQQKSLKVEGRIVGSSNKMSNAAVADPTGTVRLRVLKGKL